MREEESVILTEFVVKDIDEDKFAFAVLPFRLFFFFTFFSPQKQGSDKDARTVKVHLPFSLSLLKCSSYEVVFNSHSGFY